MKKKIALVMAVVVMVVALAGCSSNTAGNGGTKVAETKIEKIQSSGKLVLGTAADYPPYEFHIEVDGKDQIVGFDIEIAKAIAQELGVELEIVDMKFEGLLPALVTNDIDIIVAGMVATEERKESVNFSIPYYTAQQRFVVKKVDADTLKTPDDFEGLKIGAQKSTIQEGIALDKFTSSEYIGLSKITDLVLELKNNKINGVILAEPVAKAYVKQNDDLFLAEEILGQEDGVAVAVNKGNEDFVAKIDEILQKLMDEGKIDKFIADATELAEEE
ncbi:MAG: transporter substrate-binding domain-containing protein [Gudongella sp.]|jgi:polar amino acid transport system substrate-binding protein|nr:transporter substrate-binding domain-containing protein [Gudongella sp.]